MEIQIAESREDLLQILEIQAANHKQDMSSTDLTEKGFVTIKHSISELQKLNDAADQIIVKEDEKVVGYALVMPKELRHIVPGLQPMFSKFDELIYNGTPFSSLNYYVMGQICIADSHKGKGLFSKLYQKHREVLSNSFDMCITEVATRNLRSMGAHLKTGFKVLETYTDAEDEWNILVWDWRK
ncbi:GNAT family N-acetyltransferase [Robertkochia solimangrovi]|nr:GNAT family N-acetyltransferase [Robertkochia solimangrovi]